MQGTDPSFVEIMTETLGGEEEFNKFMSDWGGTFKVGQNQDGPILVGRQRLRQ